MPVVTITCNCKQCNGITAEIPQAIAAKTSVHKAVVLATMPYGELAGCKVVSR